ncbi:DNA-3-methyladenine glycosylase 2 [Methylobacillus rhizosphaerae]|nr:3-methyladenine DNA glycosylase 2 [Methylobacillus rhizosphaerae]
MLITQSIKLPPGYRHTDILAFHGRDEHSVSEMVAGNTLQKGIMWNGHPALLTIMFSGFQAHVQLHTDGATDSPGDAQALETMARHMLELTQPIEPFEAAHGDHPLIGDILVQQSGLLVAVCASPFEALTWAVTGQQISLRAAIALRRRLIQELGIRHSSGMYCYPDASHLANMDDDAFRLTGMSRSKSNTLRTISQAVLEQHLPLDAWLHSPPEQVPEIFSVLRSIKGVGPWTINYTLLRGYGWLDGSLHGDAAVRRAIRTLIQCSELDEKAAELWLQPFSPWRAILAAHLWQWLSGHEA